MTYKQIETSREIRLWITGIIVPAVTTVATLMVIPQVKNAVLQKFDRVRYKFKR